MCNKIIIWKMLNKKKMFAMALTLYGVLEYRRGLMLWHIANTVYVYVQSRNPNIARIKKIHPHCAYGTLYARECLHMYTFIWYGWRRDWMFLAKDDAKSSLSMHERASSTALTDCIRHKVAVADTYTLHTLQHFMYICLYTYVFVLYEASQF